MHRAYHQIEVFVLNAAHIPELGNIHLVRQVKHGLSINGSLAKF